MDVGQDPWAEGTKRMGLPSAQFRNPSGGGAGLAGAARPGTPLRGNAGAFWLTAPTCRGNDFAASAHDRQKGQFAASAEAPNIGNDFPPTWDGTGAVIRFEPYLKELSTWLSAARSLKTQRGYLVYA